MHTNLHGVETLTLNHFHAFFILQTNAALQTAKKKAPLELQQPTGERQPSNNPTPVHHALRLRLSSSLLLGTANHHGTKRTTSQLKVERCRHSYQDVEVGLASPSDSCQASSLIKNANPAEISVFYLFSLFFFLR